MVTPKYLLPLRTHRHEFVLESDGMPMCYCEMLLCDIPKPLEPLWFDLGGISMLVDLEALRRFCEERRGDTA